MTLFAFDPLAYIQQRHDKLFFGVGGSILRTVGGADYANRFMGYSGAILLQAGIGDYPFIFDIRYGVSRISGVATSHVSGRGSELTEYSILPALRTYLFWKHPRVKNYLLLGPLATEARVVSAGLSGETAADSLEGVRIGVCAGYGFELKVGDYGFGDLEMAYEYVPSDAFEGGRERLRLNLLLNIGL
ncbi:MAG: hypothetical protein V1913_02815 [Fibrobacterota bacterium]